MDVKRFREKLSGRVRFPEDVSSKKTLYARACRSPYPAGIIENISLPELPDECFIIDYKSIPGQKNFQFPQGEIPLLAHDRVSYRGEPILLVGAPSTALLAALMEKIEITITPEPECPPLSLELGENIQYERHFLRGEAEKILERTDLIGDEDFFSIEAQHPSSRLSPQVSCQKEGSRFVIHSINQWPSLQKKNAAACLKIRRDQILLRNYPCENSQESRLWYTSFTACHAALLCQASKRTVNFLMDEQENIDLTPPRGKTEIYIKGALSGEGDLLALKVDFALDVGAYGVLTPELIDRMTLACTGVYQCRHVEITGRGIRTNNVPCGFFPDLNVSPIFYAIESFTNNLINLGGFSSYEWKWQNRVRKGNLFLGNSPLAKPTPLPKILEALKSNADFLRKHMSYQLLNGQRENISQEQESFRRGIALSLAYGGNDFLYNHIDLTTLTVRALLNKEGQLTLFLPLPPTMNRTKKKWAQKAAEILSLEKPDQVMFQFDQERQNGGPQTAGRSISHITRQIELCCEQIQKRRFRDPLPLDVTRRYSRQDSRWDNNRMEGIPFHGLSWGGCTVEVELNPATWELCIKQIHFVLEGGLIQDEPSARITVERGLHQALDNALGPDWRKRYPFPPYEVDFISSGTHSLGIDGLVQSLFPPALAGAFGQASGRKGYTLPLEEGLMREDETK
ncbi:MAG: molybdopterin-dependent oxidoreductase [Spirochaetales bacterium]|nr:molybdopterin-dependent oxidoreductase [Spirochaetales bacterium]